MYQNYTEAEIEIYKFCDEKEQELKNLYRTFKGKDKRKFLVVTGEDNYKKIRKIHNLRKIGGPRILSWNEALFDDCIWYSLCFDYKNLDFSLISLSALKEQTDDFDESVAYSIRWGSKLTEKLKLCQGKS